MRLGSPHKDWRLDLISVMDVRAVGLDQLLTNLWLRVEHDNRQWRKRGSGAQRVVELAHQMERRGNDRFRDFVDEPGVAEAWLRADLLRVFKRAPEEFSVARPLHSLAARVRNPRRDDDSNASSVIYGWLEHCGQDLLPVLKQFIDPSREAEELDLASLGLALLGEDQEPDVTVGEPRPARSHQPATAKLQRTSRICGVCWPTRDKCPDRCLSSTSQGSLACTWGSIICDSSA